MTEKSILEQALLQIENLEEAVKQNAKGILGSVVKQELNGLLKESMKEEGDVKKKGKKDVDEQDDEEMPDVDDESPEEDEEDLETDGTDDSSDSVDGDDTSDDMSSMDDEEDTSDMDSDDMSSMEDEEDMSDMDNEDDTMDSSDDTVMDMTNASDEEVVKVFKAMKPNDGIVVKRDGNNLDVNIDGEEYVIKLDEVPDTNMSEDMDVEDMDEEEMEDMNEEEMEEGMEDDSMDADEETVYEIELDDTEEEAKEGKNVKKVEATEAARTQGNDVRGQGPRQGKKFKAGRPELNEEVSKLRKQNDEYKKALVLFKDKLNEVAVFNASLAYATRLFTEHSTTKQEKLNILKRFDSVSTMNESKKLYSTIKTELNSKKPVTESVADKISATPKSSSSKEVLAESKAYENPQFKSMKELMVKIK